MREQTPARATPRGVADGHPQALRAVRDLRGPAVFAYCELACAQGAAGEATADAFRRFRTAVAGSETPEEIEPDRLLLGSTRHAAAARAPRPAHRSVLGARRARGPCDLIFELLVARAEQRLTVADEGRLARHLEDCAFCEAAELRFRAAEVAYREAPERPLPDDVAARVLQALMSAAPLATDNGDASQAVAEEEEEKEPVAAVAPAAVAQEAKAAPEPEAAALHQESYEYPEHHDELEQDEHAPHGERLEQGGLLTRGGRRLPRARTGGATPARSREHGLAWSLGLPAGVLVAAVFTALAVAGVFGGSGGHSAATQASAAQTALPVDGSRAQTAPSTLPPTPAGAATSRGARPAATRHRRRAHRPHRRASLPARRPTGSHATRRPARAPTAAVTPRRRAPTPHRVATHVSAGGGSQTAPSSPAPAASSTGFTPSP